MVCAWKWHQTVIFYKHRLVVVPTQVLYHAPWPIHILPKLQVPLCDFKRNKRPTGHDSLTSEWHSHCRHADVTQHFSNPIIATNEITIIWAVLSFEEYMGLTVNGAWSFEKNYQSHFNRRINVKFGRNWLSGFWRIMYTCNTCKQHSHATVAGKYYKHKPDDSHLRFPIKTILTTVDLQVTSILSI